MGRCYSARENRGFICGMDTVNEALVPNRISVQVVTEAPIDEWINHISKGYESVELEPLE